MPITLQQAIDLATDVEIIESIVVVTTPKEKLYYSKDECDLLDPRYFPVLVCVCERHPISRCNVFKRTLRHWSAPGMMLADDHSKFMMAINAVYESRNTQGSYSVRGDIYDTYFTENNLQIASWVNVDQFVSVEEPWLDRHMPGLSEKIRMLQAIGLSEEEVSTLALQELVKPTEVVSLPELSIDE